MWTSKKFDVYIFIIFGVFFILSTVIFIPYLFFLYFYFMLSEVLEFGYNASKKYLYQCMNPSLRTFYKGDGSTISSYTCNKKYYS